VDNKCLQQVKNFKYLSSEISNKNEKDIEEKLAKCAQIMAILNNIFQPTWIHKSSITKVHTALPVHSFMYGSKIWTQKGRKNIDMNRDATKG
jgi:hypothetical protein